MHIRKTSMGNVPGKQSTAYHVVFWNLFTHPLDSMPDDIGDVIDDVLTIQSSFFWSH